MSSPEDAKDIFHEDLDSLFPQYHKTTNLFSSETSMLVLALTTKSGIEYSEIRATENDNSKGLLLPRTCATHDLSITNKIFQLSTRKKTSWTHRRSKHWHLIDYVIVEARDRRDVHVTKAMCGAECWSIHRLIISKMNSPLVMSDKQRTKSRQKAKRLPAESGTEDY